MRTLDRNYLASNPTGDTKAEFAISLELPASVDVANNPDGTRPHVSLKATSGTYGDLLGSLSFIHDMDLNELATAILLENVADEKLASPETMREAASEVVTPFRTFTLGIELESKEEGVSVDADLELTAPDMVTAARALKAMTRPQVLTELAISFSPETDDEYDEYDGDSRHEVLVVS
jgi:hypothetical protein